VVGFAGNFNRGNGTRNAHCFRTPHGRSSPCRSGSLHIRVHRGLCMTRIMREMARARSVRPHLLAVSAQSGRRSNTTLMSMFGKAPR
jgi:hypothetical protein